MKNNRLTFVGIAALLMVSLTLLLGCTKEVGTTTPKEFKTYSKYGFSFEYKKNMPVIETGLFENEANENSGIVQVGGDSEEVEIFQVTYLKTIQYSLEGGLEGAFAGMRSSEGIERVETGEIIETNKVGHRMLYQHYTATATTGERVNGIVGVFYCDKNQKVFALMTINSNISVEQDVLEEFMSYMESFDCY